MYLVDRTFEVPVSSSRIEFSPREVTVNVLDTRDTFVEQGKYSVSCFEDTHQLRGIEVFSTGRWKPQDSFTVNVGRSVVLSSTHGSSEFTVNVMDEFGSSLRDRPLYDTVEPELPPTMVLTWG